MKLNEIPFTFLNDITFVVLKKICTIAILLIFVYQTGGYLIVAKVQQFQIRKEIKQRIKAGVPQNELSIITVSNSNRNQLKWKHSREFRYLGVMYDVVRMEIIDTQTTAYHCVTDTQETILFAGLDDQVKRSMESKNKERNNLSNKMVLYFHFVSGLLLHPEKVLSSKIKVLLCFVLDAFPYLETNVPPPKFG